MSERTETLLCRGMVALTGVVIGITAGILIMLWYLHPGERLVERCRDRIARYDALEPAKRAKIDRLRAECPGIDLEWRIVEAVSAVKIAEKEP